MKSPSIVGVGLLLVLAIGAGPAVADDQALPQGFNATPILKSSVTASQQPLAYPAGTPEITSVIGVLAPDGRTSLHQHPIPVYVYVLEGTLTVQAEGGASREYQPGQAFLEDVNTTHQAFNKTASPVKILVVFLGAQGQQTTASK